MYLSSGYLQNHLLIFHFHQSKYKICRCGFHGIYSAWCSLIFGLICLYLSITLEISAFISSNISTTHSCSPERNSTMAILNHSMFSHNSWRLYSVFLFFLHPAATHLHSLHVVFYFVQSTGLSSIHWFFLWLSQIYEWSHEKHSSSVLPCF